MIPVFNRLHGHTNSHQGSITTGEALHNRQVMVPVKQGLHGHTTKHQDMAQLRLHVGPTGDAKRARSNLLIGERGTPSAASATTTTAMNESKLQLPDRPSRHELKRPMTNTPDEWRGKSPPMRNEMPPRGPHENLPQPKMKVNTLAERKGKVMLPSRHLEILWSRTTRAKADEKNSALVGSFVPVSALVRSAQKAQQVAAQTRAGKTRHMGN
jgi:hypothetical protein